jgi:CheY-like chemotaxis protein
LDFALPSAGPGAGSIRPVELLLVEDNPADARLMSEALKEGKVSNHLSRVPDGVEALAFLHRTAAYANAPRPDLILLDLNLPRKDGREVLAEIKSSDELRRIPVIVLTTSREERDILQSYDHHANGYISKPINLDEFLSVVRAIEEFWLSVVTLPDQ